MVINIESAGIVEDVSDFYQLLHELIHEWKEFEEGIKTDLEEPDAPQEALVTAGGKIRNESIVLGHGCKYSIGVYES